MLLKQLAQAAAIGRGRNACSMATLSEIRPLSCNAPTFGDYREAMAGAAEASQHHRELWLCRQRTVLHEVRPVGPLLLRQQQSPALIGIAQLHLPAE
jgi:hypothetical protein